MSNFRLIAIRPLNKCNAAFTKVLVPGKVYNFYDKYNFSQYADQNRVENTRLKDDLDLYSVPRGKNRKLHINICAIVGENGSGKSSLVELFYVAVYNLSVLTGVLFDELKKQQLTENDRVPDIKVEIFYEIENQLNLLRLDDRNISTFVLSNNDFQPSENPNFSFLSFFYTISINYSIHSLNSKIIGDWIKSIFHKNDGYQTPIVLNPYREEGVIFINDEEYLAKSRLIANILGSVTPRRRIKDSLRNIIDDKVAQKLVVSLRGDKFPKDKYGDIDFSSADYFDKALSPLINESFFKQKAGGIPQTKLAQYAKVYIVNKLSKIAQKYSPYKEHHQNFLNDEGIARDFIGALSADDSHVTFKLRQAINLLQNEFYIGRDESFELPMSALSRELKAKSVEKNVRLIDILPPAFFETDIDFGKNGKFKDLSSGEKQRIYSVATLIYQLMNLDSVTTGWGVPKLKFSKANVIFDEIELFFHPELQRKLINDVLQSIKKSNLRHIDGINFIFVTHSPFILSDIPSSNILRLKRGSDKPFGVDEKTFGANIHELLADEFFMKRDGVMGEFAKDTIRSATIFLKSCIESKSKGEDITTSEWDKKKVRALIDIIGESLIKNSLQGMYEKVFPIIDENEIRREIARLNSLLN